MYSYSMCITTYSSTVLLYYESQSAAIFAVWQGTASDVVVSRTIEEDHCHSYHERVPI